MNFDPYRKWLGIPSNRRPPTYYELLGITAGENDADVIRSAIDQRRMYIRSKKGEGQDGHVKAILGLIEEATSTLLVPEFKHGYDRQLGLHLKKGGSRRSYVLPSWMESRVIHVSGGGSGIVGDILGIVTILLAAFGLMAWWSFRLQNRNTNEAQAQISEPLELAQSDAQPDPQFTDPSWQNPIDQAKQNANEQINRDDFTETAFDQNEFGKKNTVVQKPDEPMRTPIGWRVAAAPKNTPVSQETWLEDPKTGVIEAEPTALSELLSLKAYKNFTFDFDFRFVPGKTIGPNGSGVVIRTTGWNDFELDPRGIEIDLPGMTSDDVFRGLGCLVVYDTKIGVPPERRSQRHIKRTSPIPHPGTGQWIHVRISCVADHLDVYINNRLVNSADGIEEIAGPIALRCQKSAVQFKNINIVEVSVADKIALSGNYLIKWKEENGKTGDLEYEFLPDLSVVRAGKSAGKLTLRKGQVWLDFEEKRRGSVLIKDITDDSFSGFHTWEDGKKSIWKATRKNGARETNASNLDPFPSSSSATPNVSSQASVMESLQGQWKCIATEEIGKVLDDATVQSQNRRIEIKGNNFRMMRLKDGSRATYVGKFEVDSSNKHFDFVGKVQDGDGKLIEWVGIFNLDGDTLRLCYRYKNNDQVVRPTVFETDTSKPNVSVYYTYKRVDASVSETQAQGKTSMFDGKSLKGWHSDSKQWQVKKGVLTGEKLDPDESGSFLVSDMTYEDFVLYTEFRLLEGNSGVQIRSEAKSTGIVVGPQADISYQENFRFLGCLTGERIQPSMIAKTSEEVRSEVGNTVNPKGWNSMKVSVQGNQVSIEVNEVSTVQATLPNGYERGVIALQLHGAGRTRIEFRKIEIEEK